MDKSEIIFGFIGRMVLGISAGWVLGKYLSARRTWNDQHQKEKANMDWMWLILGLLYQGLIYAPYSAIKRLIAKLEKKEIDMPS